MKPSDYLQFVESGTLERPGFIGRTVRAVLGLGCLSALIQIVDHRTSIIQSPVSNLPNFLLLALLGLCVFNYCPVAFMAKIDDWETNLKSHRH